MHVLYEVMIKDKTLRGECRCHGLYHSFRESNRHIKIIKVHMPSYLFKGRLST